MKWNVGETLIRTPTSRYSNNGMCRIAFAPLSSSGSMTESDIWLAEERKTQKREMNTRETFPSPSNTLTLFALVTRNKYIDGRRGDIPYLLTNDSRA